MLFTYGSIMPLMVKNKMAANKPDTGVPIAVAKFNHKAPASRAAIINQIKTSVS